MTSATVAATTDPADELQQAVDALLERSDFKWTLQYEQNNRQGWMGFEGRTGSEGYTLVKTSRNYVGQPQNGDLPAKLVFGGKDGVAEIDGHWLRPRQLAERTPMGAAMSVLANSRQNKVLVERFDVPRPELLLPALLRGCEDMALEHGAITATINPKTALALLNTGVARAGVLYARGTPWPEVPGLGGPFWEYVRADGTATFWLNHGKLVKYEVILKGQLKPGPPERWLPTTVMITTLLGEPGAITVEIPAAAKAVLDRVDLPQFPGLIR